ncbi:MAG: FAD-binding domain-containing protein [Candidatus Caenarcaniphilales bacterium]|nr:FAD-binding domain-containing protein [Candidatus Caenarcaniphilales bacterium]
MPENDLNIIWFRRDLRLLDNEIVNKAFNEATRVLPIYIFETENLSHNDFSAKRNCFLFECLAELEEALLKRGSKLHIFEGKKLDILTILFEELKTKFSNITLHFNREAEYDYNHSFDKEVENLCAEMEIKVKVGTNNFLLLDESTMNAWREQYYAYQKQSIHPEPADFSYSFCKTDFTNLRSITCGELKNKHQSTLQMNSLFKGGEIQAQKTLTSFLTERYKGYHWKISRPWLTQLGATSHLSPHIYFGTVSTRQISQALRQLKHQSEDPKNQLSLAAFQDRIRWRDSFTQRLFFHPELITKNKYVEFDDWYDPKELTPEKKILFEAWINGRTGYPLVDACMRQLQEQGWMNFRMRAMCATFLCINCNISWHHGAQYFMQNLIDADYAINNWQWQMQAGITNPINPAFRIYNPTKNLQEKDPKLEYIHHWLPELRVFSMEQILNQEYLGKVEYPPPIVNWELSKRVNGKAIADIRKKVKERLIRTQDEEFKQALIADQVVKKYYEGKNKIYAKIKELDSDLQLRLDLSFEGDE